MRTAVRNHRRYLRSVNNLICSHKIALKRLLVSDYFLGIILIVRFLNNAYYSRLCARKERKLPPRPRAAPDPPIANSSVVVTIPADLHLEEAERKVLSRGLSFCPVPNHTDQFDLHKDIEALNRRIQLRAFFHSRESAPDVPQQPSALPSSAAIEIIKSSVPSKSKWNPPPSRIPAITHFMEATDELLRSAPRVPTVPNLSAAEVSAISSLRNRRDIVIKPADKGGAIVVWDRALYIQECLLLSFQMLTITALSITTQQSSTKTRSGILFRVLSIAATYPRRRANSLSRNPAVLYSTPSPRFINPTIQADPLCPQ